MAVHDIKPLVTLEYAGTVALEGGDPRRNAYSVHRTAQVIHRVVCSVCGDVTRAQSGGTVNDAPLEQANLYQRRHLAEHLEALAKEIKEASR